MVLMVNSEYLKFKLREFSRNESIKIAKLRKVNRENLEEKVKTFARIDDPSESDLEEYENAMAELEKIYNHIAEGIILRSKSQWYEEGEKASKYFLTLEKSRKAKHVSERLIQKNVENRDPKIIMSELKPYYQNLYRKRSVKTEEECLKYLSELNTPSLSLEERELCEGKLTLTECWNALQSMKDGKTQGNDCLTKEFYVAFFGELGPTMLKTFNLSFEKGELGTSQK